MIPLSFKSAATQLNISKDKGLVLTSVGFIGNGSTQNGIDMVVEGFAVSIWEPLQVVEKIHPVEFVTVERQQQV